MKICTSLAVGLAIAVGFLVRDMRRTLGYDIDTRFDDSTCNLLEMPAACEDLSLFGDDRHAFTACADVGTAFRHGSESIQDGAVYLVDTHTSATRKLDIEGRPAKLLLHGIYYSQMTRKLYAVNHHEAAGESVEIFDVVGAEAHNLRLRHALTVHSPLFGNMLLNDVVEGIDDSELYVTEWQPFAFPIGGTVRLPYASVQTRLERALIAPINLLKIPLCRVYRCALRGTPRCEVATSTRFVHANGIAISHDRRSVFVNDPTARQITVLERAASGELHTVSHFTTKHSLDNIEMTPEGRLSGGSIPAVFTAKATCEEAKPLTFNKVVDGREIGCGRSPGGMVLISLLGTGGSSYVDGTQIEHAMHDGSKLDGISAALQLSGKVLLSGPNSPGLLLCGSG